MAGEVEEAERERKSLEEQLQRLRQRISIEEGAPCPSAESMTNDELTLLPTMLPTLPSFFSCFDCSPTKQATMKVRTPRT
jgi:hypothetical protein